jgi:hypothetical protein
MAILRDVVICYDGTVRNICSNSIIQLKFREDDETDSPSKVPLGEPVSVLATTAISNPAYKAILDSSQSNNASWESMKEILQTRSHIQRMCEIGKQLQRFLEKESVLKPWNKVHVKGGSPLSQRCGSWTFKLRSWMCPYRKLPSSRDPYLVSLPCS